MGENKTNVTVVESKNKKDFRSKERLGMGYNICRYVLDLRFFKVLS